MTSNIYLLSSAMVRTSLEVLVLGFILVPPDLYLLPDSLARSKSSSYTISGIGSCGGSGLSTLGSSSGGYFLYTSYHRGVSFRPPACNKPVALENIVPKLASRLPAMIEIQL